jgi:hypothetical protein
MYASGKRMPDFTNLPLILAGPIVRRVEPTLVSVWVALADARTVELGIWTGITNAGSSGVFFGNTTASQTKTSSSIRIGAKLHIALVTLDLTASPLIAGQIYSYNLAFTGGSTQQDLNTLKLLEDIELIAISAFADAGGGKVTVTSAEHGQADGTSVMITGTTNYDGTYTIANVTSNTFEITHTWAEDDATGWWNLTTNPPQLALGYIAGQLPSFTLPALSLANLKIAHGSCRKAHGHGVDGLAALDKIIERTQTDANARPQQLFLTGDQVYADDIAMMLLPQLTTAGNALLGVSEELPLKTVTGEIKVVTNSTNFPTTWRQELIKQQAKFTSGDAACHAMSFGEFCALYLFFWSNVLWDAFIAEDDIFPDCSGVSDDCPDATTTVNGLPAHLQTLYPTDKRKDQVKAWYKLHDAFQDQLEDVKTFKKTLPKVRRALANIATYMIFDDHEVTDDWYLTQDWRDKVLTSPLGVTVLRNALTSYALFQAWGNDPKRYDTGDHANLLTQAQALFPAGGGPAMSSANALDALYGLGGSDPVVKWHFNIPSGPTTTVVLDTRTWREFNGRYAPPGLISAVALEEQLPASFAPSPGAEVLIVVAPAPVLGLAVIEELAQPIGARGYFDFTASVIIGHEPKITGYMEFDMEAWALHSERFEALLARFNQMGKVVILSGDVHYGFSAEMDYWKKAQPQASRIVQLTSSALKNDWGISAKRALETVAAQEILHNAYYPIARLGWNDPADLIGNVSVPGGALSRNKRAMLRRTPVVLPADNWEPGSTISVAPDWVWRLSLVKDVRPDDTSPTARPADGQVGPISPDMIPGNPDDGYVKVMERAEKQLKWKIARSVTFASHLGLVSFSGTGATLKVNHTLTYEHPDGAKPADPQGYTAYELSLAPTTDPQPTIS